MAPASRHDGGEIGLSVRLACCCTPQPEHSVRAAKKKALAGNTHEAQKRIAQHTAYNKGGALEGSTGNDSHDSGAQRVRPSEAAAGVVIVKEGEVYCHQRAPLFIVLLSFLCQPSDAVLFDRQTPSAPVLHFMHFEIETRRN